MDWDLLASSLWPIVQGTTRGTIPLALASFVLGLALALVVALMRLSRIRAVAGVARAYVSVIRGTPLLVQLFVIFSGERKRSSFAGWVSRSARGPARSSPSR